MASSGSHAGSVHGIAVERGLNMPSWNFLVASKFDHFGNFVVTKRDLEGRSCDQENVIGLIEAFKHSRG